MQIVRARGELLAVRVESGVVEIGRRDVRLLDRLRVALTQLAQERHEVGALLGRGGGVRSECGVERGRRAVVEIGSAGPGPEQRGRVEAVDRNAEPAATARVDRADVVPLRERAVAE